MRMCQCSSLETSPKPVAARTEGCGPRVGVLRQTCSHFLSFLLPFAVLAEDLDASGPVVSLDTTRLMGRPLLVVVHRNSGAIVWDIR